MDANLAIDVVNQFFIYRADKKDEHRILSPDCPEGDCEDYALTVLFYICDQDRSRMENQLRRRVAGIIFCRDPQGELHNMLRYGPFVCDNQLKRWVHRRDLEGLGYSRMSETDPKLVIQRISKVDAKAKRRWRRGGTKSATLQS